MSPPANTAPAPGPTKFCGKCKTDRPLPGGVQLTREKWRCGHCWRGFAMKRRAAA